jgi:hypothetical protein
VRGGIRAEVLSNWKRLRELDEQLEATALEMLAHPDATPEQIAEVRAKFMTHRKLVTEVWQSVQKFFHTSDFVQPSPPHFIAMRRTRRAKELADKVSASVVHRCE